MEPGCLAFGGADAVFLGTAPRQAPPHFAPPHIFVEQLGTLAPLFDDTEDTPGKIVILSGSTYWTVVKLAKA